MFTGLVEEVGRVVALEGGSGDSARIVVSGPLVTSDARPGDSIAVAGVCLTVTRLDQEAGTFAADVMGETLRRSSIGRLAVGDPVNLERALRADARIGGHVVQGHVDGLGTVLARTRHPEWEVVRIAVDDRVDRYLAEKGSVAVDGTSLTVAAVGPGWFEVALIPTTLAATTLGACPVGAPVNIEVDVLAKYVERMLAGRDRHE